MRIECPGCEAAYEVPEAQMRPGRSVRCACCDLLWLPVPEPAMAMSQPEVMAAPEAAAEIAIPDAPTVEEPATTPEAGVGRVRLRQSAAPKPAADGIPTPVARFGMRLALPAGAIPWMRSSLRPGWLRSRDVRRWGLGWAASVVVLLGMLVAAGHWRTAIMHGWPPSIRLYTALGSPPPT